MPTALLKKPTFENNSTDGWPTTVDMKLIVPGLVHYDDLKNERGEMVAGNVLATKEFLDRIAASLEGKPIINWDHRTVKPKDFEKGRAQGIITTPAVFNPVDGWYHARGFIWDPVTRANVEKGFSISCAYVVSEWGNGPGTYNAVPYEQEAKDGEYTHIAVVPVPRYERSSIELLNSKGGVTMGFLKLFKKDKSEEKVEIDIASANVAVEGCGEVPLQTLINSYESAEKIKKQTSLDDSDMVEINGKKISVGDLKNAHKKMKNDEEEERKRMEDEERKNQDEDEEKKRKKEEEKKNQDDDEEKEKKKDDERKNAIKAADAAEKKAAVAAAAKLEERRNKAGPGGEMPKILSDRDRMAEGERRYGAKNVEA